MKIDKKIWGLFEGRKEGFMRASREKAPKNLYHIIMRGINYQDIFIDNQDKTKFLKELYNTKEKYNYLLYAYVIMPNHVHLVIQDSDNKLSKAMQSSLVRYSAYINQKYNRVGHLFQNRFKSKVINDKEYLKTVIRYIHYNPEKARIDKVDSYKWSSYKNYTDLNLINNPLVDVRPILKSFGKTYNTAIEEFEKFHLLYREEILCKLKNQIEYEIDKNVKDEDLIEYITKKLEIDNIYDIQKYNKKYRDKLIKKIFDIQEISALQVARVTGISRTIVTNIKSEVLKEKNPL